MREGNRRQWDALTEDVAYLSDFKMILWCSRLQARDDLEWKDGVCNIVLLFIHSVLLLWLGVVIVNI